MLHHRFIPALALLGLAAACDDQAAGPNPPGPEAGHPSLVISDGAHGGSPQFFFLPPLVPAAAYSGSFDGSRRPVVTVCELAGTACGTRVATLSGDDVKVDSKAEAYVAVWKTKEAGLDPTRTYRIEVRLDTPFGNRRLGYADVVALDGGSQIRTVDRGQFVAVVNGGSLPIRFRIEGGAVPSSWQRGDVYTYSHASWGTDEAGTPAFLTLHFNAIYAATGGVLEVGLPGAAGFSMLFTSGVDVRRYLPSTGASGPLTARLANPSPGTGGAFGGDVVALRLNVDYADAGVLAGSSRVRFGDLVLCGMNGLPALEGLSVRQLLGLAEALLGGGTGAYSIAEVHPVAADLNAAFADGVVSPFALQHLGRGSCAPVPWRDGDVITYTQQHWGTGLLQPANYNLAYASTSGVLEVGISGAGQYSILFTSASAVALYLPAVGVPAPLNARLLDPFTSASGAFGGEVTSLHLNVDFADAGITLGAAGVPFGDLTLCGLTDMPLLNGLTVRQYLDAMETALGAGPAAYGIPELHQLIEQVNSAFHAGEVSDFARAHLVIGPCP